MKYSAHQRDLLEQAIGVLASAVKLSSNPGSSLPVSEQPSATTVSVQLVDSLNEEKQTLAAVNTRMEKVRGDNNAHADPLKQLVADMPASGFFSNLPYDKSSTLSAASHLNEAQEEVSAQTATSSSSQVNNNYASLTASAFFSGLPYDAAKAVNNEAIEDKPGAAAVNEASIDGDGHKDKSVALVANDSLLLKQTREFFASLPWDKALSGETNNPEATISQAASDNVPDSGAAQQFQVKAKTSEFFARLPWDQASQPGVSGKPVDGQVSEPGKVTSIEKHEIDQPVGSFFSQMPWEKTHLSVENELDAEDFAKQATQTALAAASKNKVLTEI